MSPSGSRVGMSFGGMHRDVEVAARKLLLQFFGEQALAADLRPASDR